jgi:Rrf2 family protein
MEFIRNSLKEVTMLSITRQADYALRAVTDIACAQDGEKVSTASIAARQKIPLPFLAKIVSQLVVRGILESTRGASGGVRLAHPAEAINVCQIIEAIDGPIAINVCVHNPAVCEYSDLCALCEVFTTTQTEVVRRLESISIADLIRREMELKNLNSTTHPALTRFASAQYAGDRQ